MTDDVTATPELGQLVTRTLAIEVRGENADTTIERDAEGRQIYTALAYRYNETDTYGTTLATGSMAHVTPEDFRILEYHRADRDPVGKPVSVTETDAGPEVRFVFADTQRAQELQSLVDGGFLRAVSVGFIPTDGFVRGDGVTVFTQADLHELSLVNTPASKGALISLARELGTEEADLTAIFGELPDDGQPVVVREAGHIHRDGETVCGEVELVEQDGELVVVGFTPAATRCDACACQDDAPVEDGAALIALIADEAATSKDDNERTVRLLSRIRRHRA
jgi:HK97 family phage prohead protease